MNLHALTRQVITSVHPDRKVRVLRSAGQTIGPDYVQRPVWQPCVEMSAQVQPVPDKTLQWLLQARSSSVWRDVYAYGALYGLDRTTERGGDLLYFDDYEWQVDQVLEDFAPGAGWTKVRVIRLRVCPLPAVGDSQPPVMDDARSDEGAWPDNQNQQEASEVVP